MIMLFHFVDSADVGVIQGRGGAGFALKSAERSLVTYELLWQEFQSDPASQADVFRFVHHTHAAAAQLTKHLVVSNRLADEGAVLGRFLMGDVLYPTLKRGFFQEIAQSPVRAQQGLDFLGQQIVASASLIQESFLLFRWQTHCRLQ